ncbi:pyridoxine 5'-phosphate synthase [Campylobacter sp. CCUG 57310]|uniref:pyridoxine 5'-phosphate synthase n=1 Tax=Campylobacter sp. CCUG 57310 TaxID=2517362 RepID=UPI0015671D55|nr:pyridoxine 5'-phosphate synthase [Campylobacter sp. CCUG 57310]QKF92286.1 pyridoxine 5'-phosphate synthase [Campylobacter sp. CCUG 57310]
MLLGVNIDHIAVLREARRVNDPDILQACFSACMAGADQITIHLREDRRHINETDTQNIITHSKIPVNLECSMDKSIIDLVIKLKPARATLVPEKRQELTTEGGLNLQSPNLQEVIKTLNKNDIEVSLFIDPKQEDIMLAHELGAQWIELHTGAYANTFLMLNSNLSHSKDSIKELQKSKKELREILEFELSRIKQSAKEAKYLGLKVAAGHGLNYQNVKFIAEIPEISELNIGQSIIARSVFVGLETAIKEMIACIK